LKALNRWADTFHCPERAIFSDSEHYWNFKIPVEINLIQGKYSTIRVKAACAQALINACSNLIKATADSDFKPRITAVICLPDMFTSEICLYRSQEYYQSFVTESRSEKGASALIKDRSLLLSGALFFQPMCKNWVLHSKNMEAKTAMNGSQESAGIMVRCCEREGENV